MNQQSHLIKKGDMTSCYVIGAVAILASIVCWFLPTMEADCSLSGLVLVPYPEKIYYTFFSYNNSLSLAANILNLLFLACSVASLVLVLLPLIKNKVMSPNKTLLFPVITYSLYLVLFFVRYLNAQHKEALYTARITPVTIIYFLSLVGALSFAAVLCFFAPKLKKQQEAENTVD